MMERLLYHVLLGSGSKMKNNTYFNGIFGFAIDHTVNQNTPLIHQIGLIFSSCIGSMIDPRYKFNQLFLSDLAVIITNI